MRRNAKLFRRIADEMELYPKSHVQNAWSVTADCGTTYCIAGWAIALEIEDHPRTWTINWSPESFKEDRHGRVLKDEMGEPIVDEWTMDSVTHKSGVTHWPSDLGKYLLGLDSSEAAMLFDAEWVPRTQTVPEALRMIASGIPVEAITYNYDDDSEDEDA